MKTIIQGAEI